MQVYIRRTVDRWTGRMLRFDTRVRLGSPLYHFHLPRVLHCIPSIVLARYVDFCPRCRSLLIAPLELTERGTGRALIRLGKHFLSLSPIFEVFSTQIYTHSILSNLTFGGARYIATGRGFATVREPFSKLYSRFAGPSIYLGMRTLAMLLFISLTLWMPHLIYFWITVMALCIAPFMFNPHQFIFADFIIDYREYLRWMSRGNSLSHVNSWIGYCRMSRTMITGYKKKKLGHPSEKLSGDVPRAKWRNVLFSEIIFPIFMAVLFVIAFMFVNSFPDSKTNKIGPSPLLRIAVISLGPIVWNAAVLIILFMVSLFLGPMMGTCYPKFGSLIAAIAHGSALIGLIAFLEFMVRLIIKHHSDSSLTFIVVVLGTLGSLACRSRCYCRCLHPACD